MVFEQAMTDTALYADVVLPATTFLEGYRLREGVGRSTSIWRARWWTLSARHGRTPTCLASLRSTQCSARRSQRTSSSCS